MPFRQQLFFLIVVAFFLLIVLEQVLLTKLPDGIIKQWWAVEYSLILVLLMIFRPRGIFGPRELTDVWRDWRAKRKGKEAPA